MILIVWGNRQRWQLVNLVILGLADTASLWMGTQNLMMFSGLAGNENLLTGLHYYSWQLLALWGIWLYLGVIDGVIICEVLVLLSGKRAVPG
jgi:hypothetical protein